MSNTRSLIIGIFVIIVLLVGAVVLIRFLRSNRNSDNKPTNIETSVTPSQTGNLITLKEQNRSKTEGTITLEELDGQVRVVLSLSKYPQDTLQPVNIYMGTCDEPGSVLYPLADAFNGQSVTTLPTTKARLSSQKPLVLAVMKSQKDSKIASCGAL